jgi:hypothetical protein
MAGNKNSGGFRPTAPQNNPANVNAMGGDGQSGQANPNYTGFAYGQNSEINTTADSATMYKETPASAAPANPMGNLMSGVVPLDAPTQDDLPVSDGVDVGRGRGSEALPSRVTSPMNQSENLDLIKRYLPDLMDATRMPNAPDSYKRFVNYLKEQIL